MATKEHSNISPTAKLVAYLRTFTDIPYSIEIAHACDAQKVFEEMVGENPQDFLWVAPMIEMRYKSIEAISQEYDSRNVVELASGVSPRGLVWSDDIYCTFLETDLPEMLVEKIKMTGKILAGKARGNLQLLSVNAVNDRDFRGIDAFFDEGPIMVLNEGLLPYLDHEEKNKVAQNILRLLKKRGGVWITPDVSSNDRIKELAQLDPKIGQVIQTISGRTGRDLQNNSFGSMEEAERFFTNIGFKLTKFNQRDLVPKISSLDKVEVDKKKLDAMTEHGSVWVMEAE